MKQEKQSTVVVKAKQSIPAPPPLPRSWERKKTVEDSVTNREIANFWRKKRVEEEDHLLAAIKAAARLRARNLTEEDYRRFEESLNNEDNDTKGKQIASEDENTSEIRIGIKDWWTKSKYAYLNQPAINSNDTPKRFGSGSGFGSSSFVPNCFTYKPAPLYPTALGVF